LKASDGAKQEGRDCDVKHKERNATACCGIDHVEFCEAVAEHNEAEDGEDGVENTVHLVTAMLVHASIFFRCDKCCVGIYVIVQIFPRWVHYLDCFDFPCTLPSLDLLLAPNGIVH
jgi:hypothetical protein